MTASAAPPPPDAAQVYADVRGWRDYLRGEEAAIDDETRDEIVSTIVGALNPRDDDMAFDHIVLEALTEAIVFIRTQPCTCLPGEDGEPCYRCQVLGRWHDEVEDR